ncbi:MAG: hypothetical protein CM15mP59_1120 [Flavobacteriaceae bacterium]|nr:MAG: hypothetical protein CM15mP59_1120 [Flavobacteriaceae bacterium]
MYQLDDFQNGQVYLSTNPWNGHPFRWSIKSIGFCENDLILKNKVGHAGTLDPLATGLLLVCTGKKPSKFKI